MTASDLQSLVEDMQPVGQPKPPEKELQVRAYSDALYALTMLSVVCTQACVDDRRYLVLVLQVETQ